MEYRKERNFIVAYENDIMQSKWDIVNNEYYGKRNTPVTRRPQAFSRKNIFEAKYDVCRRTLWFIVQSNIDISYKRDGVEWPGHRLECLMSVGLVPKNPADLLPDIRLSKDVVEFCKQENDGYFNIQRVQQYLTEKQYSTFLQNHSEQFRDAFRDFTGCYPVDFVKAFLLRAEREHIFELCAADYFTSLRLLIDHYYKMSMALYGKVEVKPNLLTYFATLQALYSNYQEINYNKTLQANNDIPALYFRYNGYTARPLLSKEEFHNEGEQQHNCVERLYMQRVYNNDTHVVVVRRDDNPDKSCITCEVDNTGMIQQFLRFANRHQLDAEQQEFYTAYKTHLQQNFPG